MPKLTLWQNPPGHWKKHGDVFWAGVAAAQAWEHPLAGLTVLRSYSETKDGAFWVHLSVSRKDRLPSWEELNKVRNEFAGEEVEAYQVLAAKKDHVNIHSRCLHLWLPVDGVRRVANLKDLVMERSEPYEHN